ncbi:PhoH family protein [Evansella cellulosilytica]|uniref:PhoH family protein n=1 Tax=Evansella cellulosilytica (strain ATCC 21833 / DSM 2522 / FERM P-1141 / JCM 9156 / N-4) TaxID=649639 RepID=E6TUL3_EVAC2|nr:PhoH family protein [Evansella cellulosilytica]ADU30903.1 PhoH family protein [Evansella cellulosilytica DSM 2522]
MSTRRYILDTNVLLQDPLAIYAFDENEVVIPAVVLEEVDSKKRNMDEIGRNARYVARLIDELREEGKLHLGVKLTNGGTFRVELNHRSFGKMKEHFLERTNDNRILAVALNMRIEEEEKQSGITVTLVSKDALLRVKADALGIHVEDFLSDRVVQYDRMYTGYKELSSESKQIDELFENKKLLIKDSPISNSYPNQFFILKDEVNPSRSALGMTSKDGNYLESFVSSEEPIWGIRARNVQQRMAFELLTRDDIPLVTLAGKAGTGKTLLSLAAGLYQTEDLQKYKKLLVARPVVPVGKDIGYLPGEKEEKLRPWMQPIFDNLEYLFNTKKPGELEQILAGMGSIQVEALTYIRGRSIPEQFIIIDEAQNLTKHEVKTILTRVGEGSKIVLMGDPKQIDHPYLDEYTNGLTYVTERLKHLSETGHVKLQKGERSGLAQMAADLL